MCCMSAFTGCLVSNPDASSCCIIDNSGAGEMFCLIYMKTHLVGPGSLSYFGKNVQTGAKQPVRISSFLEGFLRGWVNLPSQRLCYQTNMGLSLMYFCQFFVLFIYLCVCVCNVCLGASLTLSQTVASLLRIQMALSVPLPLLKPSQPSLLPLHSSLPPSLPPSVRSSIRPFPPPLKVLLRIINSYHFSWSSTLSRDTCSLSLRPANSGFVSQCPFCSPHNFHSERMPHAPKRA